MHLITSGFHRRFGNSIACSSYAVSWPGLLRLGAARADRAGLPFAKTPLHNSAFRGGQPFESQAAKTIAESKRPLHLVHRRELDLNQSFLNSRRRIKRSYD
jgi:hypothetical protein